VSYPRILKILGETEDVFSLYMLTQEWQAALQVLKKLASLIATY
jgi:hypothetical protein